MRLPARQCLLAALVLLFGQRIAAGHGSLESTLSFWVRGTGIDVRIYMSRGSAAVLLEQAGEPVTIVRDNFPTFEKRLADVGPALLVLSAAEGTTLQAQSSGASITDEDDICYSLHYPLPKVMPGPLGIHGSYLDKMDDGHVGSIYVLGAANDPIAQGEIRPESPDFGANLPAVPAAVVESQPAAAAAPDRAVSNSRQGTRWGLWAMAGISAGTIVIVAWRGIARESMGRRASP